MKKLFFTEFLYALKEGKKLRKFNWPSNFYIQLLSNGIVTHYLRQTVVHKSGAEEYGAYQLSGLEIFEEAWVEYKENK